MRNKIVERRVIAFLARVTGADGAEITGSTRLIQDLGVDGADADELIRDFSDEFKVSLAGYRHEEFFGPEGAFFPVMLLLPSWWRRRRSRNELTVSDLVRWATCGQLWP